jgi:hypothetical protein
MILADEANRLDDLADCITGAPELRYDMLRNARECRDAIALIEWAIGKHQDGWYQRHLAWYTNLGTLAEAAGRHWSDDPKVWANEPAAPADL